MQKKDIKVGEHYAYGASSYSIAQRVVVVSLDGRVSQGYSYNRRTISGITVARTDGNRKGEQFVVTGRNLRHAWAVEEKLRKDSEERQAAARTAKEETAARRAGLARRIEHRLTGHGEEAESVSVFDPDHRNALKAVGYIFGKGSFGDEERSTQSRFSIDQFMRNGTLNEKAITVLLADVDAESGRRNMNAEIEARRLREQKERNR